jgi:flagellar biosynthesis/type III secretory pathway M-ring protein FliF/YscJ
MAEARNQTFLEKNKDLVHSAIKYGLLALAALLLIIFVIRPARRALQLAGKQQSQLVAGSQGAPLALPPGHEISTSVREVTEGENMHLSVEPDFTSPRTVAEIEAEMEAKVAREMSTVPAEVVRASAIKKQLVERAKQKPETIAMTLRGWLQEKPS